MKHALRFFIPLLMLLLAVPVATAQTGQRCFPETSQCISGRIREFWEQNGGLPVFGFPIGLQQEEQIEGKPFQVQWFERNRLELHPENARPYDVLLGRLGADRLGQQGRDPFTFPTSEPQPGCRYFPETKHNACGDILKSWHASGLEFDGRRGKSEAENLALFGLPLSDAQTETIEGKEYTVQWYERARFELHPENAPPYNVLLGLLGNEVRGQGAPPPPPPPPGPAPLSFNGSGQTVTDPFPVPAAMSRVTLHHTGEENFIVWAYFANGDRELLANTIGSYSGDRLLAGSGSVYLEIKADGQWSITAEALNQEPGAAQGISGHGDHVSGYFTPARTGPVPMNVSHTGSENFIVWLRCAGGDDLVENEIGAVDASVVARFEKGPCLWDVQADGDWSIKPK